MGTGALGLGIGASPVPIPVGGALGAAIWSLAAAVFAILFPLLTLRVLLSPSGFVVLLRAPATAQLWGLPPMAAFSVVIGLVRIVAPHGGGHLAIVVAQGLWIFGVAGSVFSAFIVPYLMITEHELRPESALGTWVLPVVPPVVAAVPAALLLPTFPAALQPSILVIAYAMLSLGLALTALKIAVYYARLLFHKVPTGGLTPGMWLVVGPLGQSIAGAYALGLSAALVWPEFDRGFVIAAVVYGMFVWGFANYWLALAMIATLRVVRAGMPFTLRWWAFCFATGMLTSGTDALYAATGAGLFAFIAVAQLALLAGLWLLVATLTVRRALRYLVPSEERATSVLAQAERHDVYGDSGASLSRMTEESPYPSGDRQSTERQRRGDREPTSL
jgi:tellurite resistance protein TehA-like permease